MPSLLLVSLVLQILIHLLNQFGAATVKELLWFLYSTLPTRTSADARSQIELRWDVVRLKREMNSTSSQDEFAKWAKLRRQHDKVMADYEQKTQSLQSFKTSFDSAITALQWAGTKGIVVILQFWFSKTPLFWLPRGWVPNYVEWILCFPRAPMGSVSIQIWGIACASVVEILSAALMASRALVMQKEQAAKGKGEPMKMSSGGGMQDEKMKAGGRGMKKEL